MNWSDAKARDLMIRIGLGIFFLIFGLLKFVAADWFVNEPYNGFYGVLFPVALLYIVAIVQIVMAVSFFMNKYTKWSGWVASAMMLSTIIATFPKILTVFSLPPPSAPPGFLFVAAIPILFMALSEALKPEGREA
tara:strand:+ start:96 stop:500 length:405 start_codon:yes stop_codon:yes gene_type:complete